MRNTPPSESRLGWAFRYTKSPEKRKAMASHRKAECRWEGSVSPSEVSLKRGMFPTTTGAPTPADKGRIR